MSYRTQAQLAHDENFLTRVTACVATQGEDQPQAWAAKNRWKLSAAPTFDEKYAYAKNTGVENPGNEEAVISDGDILSAVQAILTAGAVATV